MFQSHFLDKEGLEKEFPVAEKVFSPIFQRDEIIPIASMSKAFFGLATVLFLYDNKNAYLLGNEKPENITIGQLLANRKQYLLQKLTEGKNKLLEEKLADINDYLEYARRNLVFANTTIKSLLNHTSQISKGNLDLSEKGSGDLFKGFSIEPTEIIAYFEEQKCFLPDNSTNYRYSNEGFTMAGIIMDLMTDYPIFFDEIRERVLIPLHIKNQVMPYFQVPEDKRQNFMGSCSYFSPFSYDKEAPYTRERTNCSVAAGGLCATMLALEKFYFELINFYEGKDNVFSKEVNGKQVFENFKTVSKIKKEVIKEKETGVTITEEHSLGFYRGKRSDNENYVKYNRPGVLPPLYCIFAMEKDGEEIKNIELKARYNDIYCHVAMLANVFLFSETIHSFTDIPNPLGKLNPLAKFPEGPIVSEKTPELKAFKDLPEMQKKEVVDTLINILNIAYNPDKRKEIKKSELTKEVKKLNSNKDPISKLFANKISEIAGINLDHSKTMQM